MLSTVLSKREEYCSGSIVKIINVQRELLDQVINEEDQIIEAVFLDHPKAACASFLQLKVKEGEVGFF